MEPSEKVFVRGIVLMIRPTRGFGFIKGLDNLTRFFHAQDVIPRVAFDTMHEGQLVEFHPVDLGEKGKGNGLRAKEVKVIQPSGSL